MTSSIRNGEDGSMLIEVLVAFVILASTIIMAFQVFGDGLRRMNAVEPKMLAVAIARRELALINNQTTLTAGRLEGADASGLRWQIALDPITVGEPDWTQVRPFKARIWIGRTAQDFGGGPLLETVVLASAPKQ
jgi:hypothetical protein